MNNDNRPTNNDFEPINKTSRIRYDGSTFWLIFWVIVFFPIAFMLLFTGSTFISHDTEYRFRYDGSIFWLGFWTLVFFPVAFLLLFLNGCAVSKTGA